MREKKIEEFLKYEYDTSFFALSINEVLIWKYFREEIFNLFLQENYHVEPRVAAYAGLKKWPLFIKKNIKFFMSKNASIGCADILFCNFPRKVKVDGKYICTQLEQIIENIEQKTEVIEYPFWIEDMSYETAHFMNEGDNIYITDRIEIKACIKSMLSFLFFPMFIFKNHAVVKKFIRDIENILGISVNKKNIITKMFFYIKYEKYIRKDILKLLKKVKPKYFVEVYTPNRQLAVFNEVCHELSIPIIDIQHGALNQYEPIMYSYYKKENYKHLGDYLFTFGEYWSNKKNLHFQDNRICAVGNPFLEYMKSRLEQKKKNTILVLSQTRYHRLFIDLCNRLAEKFDYQVVLKLHPYEFSYYCNGDYCELEEKGIEVIFGLDKHLYELFATAVCVVGINSTSLFEALAFEIPVFYLKNMYETEIFRCMEISHNIVGFNDMNDLCTKIEKMEERKIEGDIEELFTGNSINKIKSIMGNLLEKNK